MNAPEKSLGHRPEAVRKDLPRSMPPRRLQILLSLILLISLEGQAIARMHLAPPTHIHPYEGQGLVAIGPNVKGTSPQASPPTSSSQTRHFNDYEPNLTYTPSPLAFKSLDGPNLYAYVKQNPWTGWDPDGLKKRSDYQADYDTAKTNQEALGKVDVRKMTPGQFIKHGAAYAKAGQDMKKAQEGINKIEATAKEVNQAIDTINSVRKKLGYEGEIPFHVNAEGLDDESHDHKVIFDIASNWSNAKQKAFESLTGVAVGGVAKLGGALMARGATPGMARVTSWADEGITPDLNPGRWVQMGDATNWNFIKTGLGGPKIYRTDKFPFFTKESSRVPFANSVTGEVPTSSLRWPSGWEKIKGILGQRQIQE